MPDRVRPSAEAVLPRVFAALAATWAALVALTLDVVVVWVAGPRSPMSIGVFTVFAVTCASAATLTARAVRAPAGAG